MAITQHEKVDLSLTVDGARTLHINTMGPRQRAAIRYGMKYQAGRLQFERLRYQPTALFP